jgi:signal transduction histidine kinase
MSSQQEQLRKNLQEELAKESPDLAAIGSLTEQLLDEDKTAVRFTVDAHHIQRLGFELVGKQETALSELIKNAYDADATQVQITFSNYVTPGGSLVVEDDGTGMDEETIRKAWMRLSTDEKERHPLSDQFGRLRAGRKGIGRFAAQRLGKSLILETKVLGASEGVRVHFSWDEEFTRGRSLFTIANKLEHFSKEAADHGTKLIINTLRDRWSDTIFDRVWRSVILLQPPFKIAKSRPVTESKNIGRAVDPGFHVVINGMSGENKRTEFSIEKSLLEHALAEITGSIDKDGNAEFRVVSRKLGVDDRHIPQEKYLLVGPTNLETKYFIFDSAWLSGLNLRVATSLSRQYGGIRVYRNGFRVPPYGDPENDWLNLGRDTARRSILIPANNPNFFGEVSISAEENILLEETSSREGLIENEAFEELRKFARECVEWGALRIGAIRERKQKAGQKDFVSKVRNPTEVIQSLLNLGKAESSAEQEKAFKDAVTEARAFEEKVEKERDAFLRYEAMLRILASLGISIAVFGHEIKGANASIATKLKLLEDAIETHTSDENKDELNKRVQRLAEGIERIFSLGNYVAALMSNTESRALKTVSVPGAIERFIGNFSDYMHKQGVQFDISDIPADLRTTEIHPSELDSVFFNFLTNSIKAMKRAKVLKRKIRIAAAHEGAFVLISFEDNGIGISPEIQERIFDAFFTTTAGDEDDIAGPGTGLGLRIVADIANSYGGSASVGDPSAGYNSRFDFRILSAGA